MIVDSSAIVAVLREEPEAGPLFEALLANAGHMRMSAANYLEAGIVIDQNDDPALSARLDALLAELQIEIIPVSSELARIGRQAYREFGKGNHPARLNFGDCFAYALAKASGEPLLFKGNDFSQTDIIAA
ncbi:MAG: type II toxin-antitoxin system VapC family toxin [Pseudomonadota bacterium]